LESLRNRLPDRRQIFLLFLAIIFPVSFWSLIIFFRELPSYLLRMNIWEITGVFSYTQFIVLLDCIIILFFVLGLAIVLPRKYFLSQFTPQATITSYLAILWIIPFHYRTSLIQIHPKFEEPWFNWLWLGIMTALFISSIYVVKKSSRLQRGIQIFVDKLSLVSSMYLILSLISLIIIFFRNLG
jgi:hypothetical protein